MKVVYEQELSGLAQKLHTMGFEMHPMDSGILADAVLFSGTPARAFSQAPGKGGALLINVRGLSAAETAQALRSRIQGTLFS